MSAPRVLVLDHRDSFVHLLADQLARVGARVDVVRADLDLDGLLRCLAEAAPDLVVLSPGPGHPEQATLARAWLATAPSTPVFGVCLGHQVIGLAAGARIERGREPAHGEACEVEWRPQAGAAGFAADALPRRMPVARYHSLVVVEPEAPLRALATTRDGDRCVVMAIEHAELPQLGVQFHPESVLTPHGQPLLAAVLGWARRRTENLRVTENHR